MNTDIGRNEQRYGGGRIPNAWSSYFFNAQLGLRRAVGGVEYLRCREWPWALSAVEAQPGVRVLDIGSGQNIFPLLLLDQPNMRGSTVLATDISAAVFKLARFMPRLEKRWGTSRTIQFKQEDGTQLTFPDQSFDRVTCISAIEHVPDGGDSAVATEIGRVLRSGGVAVLTFPGAKNGYDIWRDDDMLMQKYDVPRTFWAHIYTHDDVMRRIVEPSGLVLEEMRLVGETGFHFENRYRTLGKANILIRPLLPLLAGLFLHDQSWQDLSANQPNPSTWFIKLRKS